jgi:molybdate transport system substrate-binding protein
MAGFTWIHIQWNMTTAQGKEIIMARGVRFPVSRRLLACLFCILLSSAWSIAALAQAERLVVFAATSLKDALDEVNEAFRREKGTESSTSFAASSTLAKHIEAAAPADVFISADLDWMDYLAEKKLIKPETRANLLGNRLVLIAPADSTAKFAIGPNFPLAQALGNGRLAIADPEAVPAGKYGKAALEALGAWSAVADRLAPAANVRSALALVARGEAPLGIVYQTDAASSKSVKIVGTFPEDSHPPIIYPMAVMASSTNPAAVDYLAYLKSPAARAIFEKYGFAVL